MKRTSLLSLIAAAAMVAAAPNDLVTYAGNAGKERFNTVVRLSDGTVLVGGQAENLDWIPADAQRREIAATGINSASAGSIGFIVRLNADQTKILSIVHFPPGTVRDVFRIRTTEVPGQPTGDLYLSGNRDVTDAAKDGYYLARLDNNFVNGLPTACRWVRNVENRKAGGSYKDIQPWDVGSDGKVIFGFGQDYGYDWAAMTRLTADGVPDVVPYWPIHWPLAGGETNVPAPSYPGGAAALRESGIILKAGRKGSLRSLTWDEFNKRQSDGNGRTDRKGTWPDDYYFKGPCLTDTCHGGPGYTGYRTSDKPTQRLGQIAIDRRTNSLYFGYSTQTRLPDGNPDFEPAVVGMDKDGRLLWWSRLYEEIERVGENTGKPQDAINSPPDQYVDGIEVDYSRTHADSASIIVLARSHGNGVINLWEGNEVAAVPGKSGFQNRFTGSSGNIHIQWLGRLRSRDGVLLGSTYAGEWAEGTNIPMDQPSTDPLMDGWPSPNAGWPNLNTTRIRSSIRLDAAGNVYVAGTGRRTITTSNAYQKMIKPSEGASAWNEFVRIYNRDLSRLLYSSLLIGRWDPATGGGGGSYTLNDIYPLPTGGVFVAGQQNLNSSGVLEGNPVTTAAVPAWGSAAPQSESALFARLTFENGSIPVAPLPDRAALAFGSANELTIRRRGGVLVIDGLPADAAHNVTVHTVRGDLVGRGELRGDSRTNLAIPVVPGVRVVLVRTGAGAVRSAVTIPEP